MKQAVREHVPSDTEGTGRESEGHPREGDLGEGKRRTESAVVVASQTFRTQEKCYPVSDRAPQTGRERSLGGSFSHRSSLSISHQPGARAERNPVLTAYVVVVSACWCRGHILR